MEDLLIRCGRYVGVPRLYHGRTPAGWDCWGLVRYVGTHDLGFDWPDFDAAYADCVNGDPRTTATAISRVLGHWRLVETPYPGCVATFDRRGLQGVSDPRIFHVGLIVAPGQMLHVTEESGTVIERYDGFIWKRFWAGAREFCHE